MAILERIPAVSVLMPVRDALPYLEGAVESVLSQTLSDLECVAVDDGSTDGSVGLLDRLASRDPRLRVVRLGQARGIVTALNTGLECCRAPLVARMDADDLALPRRLELQLATLERSPGAVALGGAVAYVDATGRDLGVVRRSTLGRSLLFANPLLHPTVVFRREALENHAIRYEERYRHAEDYFLWLRLSRIGELAALDDVVVRYRITRTASRATHVRSMIRATLRAKLDAVRLLGLRPAPADLARFAAEAALLLLPARLVLRLYARISLGRSWSTIP